MNHKPSLTLLFLAFLLFSYSSKKSKSDFSGIWEYFDSKHSPTVITFHYDSLDVDVFAGDFHSFSK